MVCEPAGASARKPTVPVGQCVKSESHSYAELQGARGFGRASAAAARHRQEVAVTTLPAVSLRRPLLTWMRRASASDPEMRAIISFQRSSRRLSPASSLALVDSVDQFSSLRIGHIV